MARIAVGGIQHETNTFAATRADCEAFLSADAWPALVSGAALPDAVRGRNLPVAGFIDAARALDHRIAPLLWCAAQPSGPVTEQAFETIVAALLTALEQALPVDAVYLDLHGAMVTEHLEAADAEVLGRVRARIGPEALLVATLDFHANVGREMLHSADALLAYRTYPHVDMEQTGARAAQTLHCMLGSAPRPTARHLVQLPFLIPLTSQCTLLEPFASLTRRCAQLEGDGVMTVGLTAGFPLADVHDCGPAVFAYGSDPERVRHAAEALAAECCEREGEFAAGWLPIARAVRQTREWLSREERPAVLADACDNPGAGGNADTVELLVALLEAGVGRVAAGVYCDPGAAREAHRVGAGGSFEGQIGTSRGAGGRALRGRFRVAALGDGRFTATGPFYRGSRMELGPMAQLVLGDARIVVASRKQQAADQAMFRHVGVEPAEHDVLVLKSAVHFRADFGGIARRVLIVEGPGPCPLDPGRLAFTRLRPGVRTRAREHLAHRQG